ncbi:MAG: PIN domain-containing protein [Nitriliruptorales bacterium]|nr:PIN domain-containing protein [Nitriliruptorales bacterium]
MIAVDTNILLYAHRAETSRHTAAQAALRRLAAGPALWAVPVFVLGEFLRVATHPRVFTPPSMTADAVAVIEAVLASPSVRLLTPGERFWPLLRQAVDDADARGNLVFDAQIAAVCREHGVRSILSEDRDFMRFPTLEVVTLDSV